VDSDCPNDKYCFKTIRCEDPCPGACGTNANCKAVYHRAECSCFPGYTGNPMTYCSRIEGNKIDSWVLKLFWFANESFDANNIFFLNLFRTSTQRTRGCVWFER
jgi:hypothetical protein